MGRITPFHGAALCAAWLFTLVGCASTHHQKPDLRESPPDDTKRRVTLTYLGVAGFQISDGRHHVLVDPYFSRPSPGAIDNEPLTPDREAIVARAPRKADLILVGHSHFDHVLDVPSVALHTGAQVMGSLSTARLAHAAGVAADRVITVQGGEDFAFDGFSVRVIPSLHSALDDKHTTGGHTRIPEDLVLPLKADQYLEGGTFAYLVRMAGVQVLVLSTANYIESELAGIHPDIAVVATGLRDEVYDYTCRLMQVLGKPRVVISNHFDDWRAPFRVLTRAQLNEDTRSDLDQFEREVRACAPNTRVIVPTHREAMMLP